MRVIHCRVRFFFIVGWREISTKWYLLPTPIEERGEYNPRHFLFIPSALYSNCFSNRNKNKKKTKNKLMAIITVIIIIHKICENRRVTTWCYNIVMGTTLFLDHKWTLKMERKILYPIGFYFSRSGTPGKVDIGRSNDFCPLPPLNGECKYRIQYLWLGRPWNAQPSLCAKFDSRVSTLTRIFHV